MGKVIVQDGMEMGEDVVQGGTSMDEENVVQVETGMVEDVVQVRAVMVEETVKNETEKCQDVVNEQDMGQDAQSKEFMVDNEQGEGTMGQDVVIDEPIQNTHRPVLGVQKQVKKDTNSRKKGCYAYLVCYAASLITQQ